MSVCKNITFTRSLSDKGRDVSRMFRNSSTNLITVTGLKKDVADMSAKGNINTNVNYQNISNKRHGPTKTRQGITYIQWKPHLRWAQALVVTPPTLKPLTNVASVTKSSREKGSGHCDITAVTICFTKKLSVPWIEGYSKQNSKQVLESNYYTSKMATPWGQHQVLVWFLEACPSVFHAETAGGGTNLFSQQFELWFCTPSRPYKLKRISMCRWEITFM